MDYRDPITVIDETIDNLVFLVEWWLEDLDVAVARDFDLLTWDDATTVAALRASRALLPRLRIVRSNYQTCPSLPDARGRTKDLLLAEYVEQERAQLRRLIAPYGGFDTDAQEPAHDA